MCYRREALMKKRQHLKAWANHAALNAGSGLRCVYHAFLPPQVDHMPHTVQSLARSNPVKEFLFGLGALKRSYKDDL